MATLSLLLGALAPESMPLGKMSHPVPVATADLRNWRRFIVLFSFHLFGLCRVLESQLQSDISHIKRLATQSSLAIPQKITSQSSPNYNQLNLVMHHF
jgi:hypothetical protein